MWLFPWKNYDVDSEEEDFFAGNTTLLYRKNAYKSMFWLLLCFIEQIQPLEQTYTVMRVCFSATQVKCSSLSASQVIYTQTKKYKQSIY